MVAQNKCEREKVVFFEKIYTNLRLILTNALDRLNRPKKSEKNTLQLKTKIYLSQVLELAENLISDINAKTMVNTV